MRQDMQLVTPREAAIAVKIDITISNTGFQVSFFIGIFLVINSVRRFGGFAIRR